VVARTDGQLRTYRVSRIRGAEPLEGRFERPNGFDLAAFWAESSAAYEREAPRAEVVIRIRPERVGWLSEAVGRRAADEAERLEVLDPEGWIHLRLRVEWPDEVAHAMLRLGSGVEVLEPLAVRDEVTATARRILDRYGEAAVEEATAAVAGRG
jgi:predicted DNA-binding transcriptional regulator YafY